ncbi:MAG: hypothetical protein R2774_09535 [Saprospiraceae bacterium]
MNNLNLLIVAFITCFYFSCTKDENQKTVPIPCVTAETITDTISGFLIFEKGKQENGFAKGIKINKPFESSVILDDRFLNDSIYNLLILTFWPERNNYAALSESIVLNRILIKPISNCLNLTNNRTSKDSIFTTYGVGNDDVGILGYELDLSEENALEIISFDLDTKKFKAKFKGSFIAKKEYLPDLPKKVRFSDVYIEYGY